MPRRLLLLLLLACALVLSSCRSNQPAERKVLVSLVESDAFTVDENGLEVYPGKNAEFILHMKSGRELTGTDYSGTSRIWQENGVTHLLLENVCYPERVSLQVTSHYRTINYDVNGGVPLGENGGTVTVTRSIQTHLRPNTEKGTDLFERPGYTLVCWNTAPDGSGDRIGLGSRVTVPEDGITLYAQWEPWCDESTFSFAGEESVTITGWTGTDDVLVIPAVIDGKPVTGIAVDAFTDAKVSRIVLPVSMETVAQRAFSGSTAESLVLFDHIREISDLSFADCSQLSTVYINAAEAPYGYSYRRESILADKADLLIMSQGCRKAVFYGGCSMWYNLDGEAAEIALGGEYTVINMGLNGTCSSLVQMEIISAYLEEGDIFFHTPELSSPAQLLTRTQMDKKDDKLWCGLEYNYDLFSLVDIRSFSGALDSLCIYLNLKDEATDYRQTYRDSEGRLYMDQYGCIPFERTVSDVQEADPVYLDPQELAESDLTALKEMYRSYLDRGVQVYVSYACLDLDALKEEERDLVGEANTVFRRKIEEMNGPKMISTLWDYLVTDADCFDTAYHLLSAAATRNTACWMRDLLEQREKDVDR